MRRLAQHRYLGYVCAYPSQRVLLVCTSVCMRSYPSVRLMSRRLYEIHARAPAHALCVCARAAAARHHRDPRRDRRDRRDRRVGAGSAKTDLFYERKKYGFKKR